MYLVLAIFNTGIQEASKGVSVEGCANNATQIVDWGGGGGGGDKIPWRLIPW